MLALGRQAAVGAGRRSQQGIIRATAAAAALQYGGLRQLSYEIKKVRPWSIPSTESTHATYSCQSLTESPNLY